MPNNIVDNIEQCCPNNIVASCFQQLLIFGRVYALVVVKNICLRDKSRNYCPRKRPGACNGDDFGLVEKWKSLFWAVQTVIVSSAESQQRYACMNKTLN